MAFITILMSFTHLLPAANHPTLVAQPLVGTYTPTGHFQVLQERTTTIVDSRISDSNKIIHELKKQGFRCGKKVQVYKCIGFTGIPEIPSTIKVQPRRTVIEFGIPKTLTELNEANEVTQFFITQDIFIDDEYYEKAWYTITDQYNKVRAGEEKHPMPVHLFFEKGRVSELQFYKETHSRFSWTDYIVQVNYR